jgi:succinate dehydrogenase / fumarate reductase, flavoprotein subunit
MSQVLVVGGGLAGLRAAIAASESGASVRVVSKVHPMSSHSVAATGGMNVALVPDDASQHVEDTLAGGANLGDRDAVEKVCFEAGAQVCALESWGVPFDRGPDGRLGTKSMAGSARARTVYAGNHTGKAILQAVWQRALSLGVSVKSDCMLVDLIVESNRCVGGVFLDLPSGAIFTLLADAVVLATGGLGQLYRPTTNAVICTGDGTAAAFRAGATLMDMEMAQFYPACFPSRGILVTEEVRAHGARYVNSAGEYFMERYDPINRDMAGRDLLSRALYAEIAAGRSVYLDCRSVPTEQLEGALSPFVALSRRLEDVDPAGQWLPIVPGMHYHMGGIKTDLNARTSLPGLFAAGECACLSVHGANRIGGNGLLETIVMGRTAGAQAAAESAHVGGAREGPAGCAREMLSTRRRCAGDAFALYALRNSLGDVMMSKAGIIREETTLRAALTKIEEIGCVLADVALGDSSEDFNQQARRWLEARNLAMLAKLLIRSAILRRESRGAHRRDDFPASENHAMHTLVRASSAGECNLDLQAARQ